MTPAVDWVAVLEFVGLLVAGIASHATLRSKVGSLETQVAKLEEKHDALDTRIVDKLSLIDKSLARIEGRMGIMDNKNS